MINSSDEQYDNYHVSINFNDPAYLERLNNQMVRWEQENASMDQYFRRAHEIIDEPRMDVVTAILYLGQLNQMQFNVYVTGKTIRLLSDLEQKQALKKHYRRFIQKTNEISDRERAAFDGKKAPTEEHEFISWFNAIANFYRGSKTGQDKENSPGAIEELSQLDHDFHDAVSYLVEDYEPIDIEPSLFEFLNMVDSQGGNLIDDTFIKNVPFHLYKKIEKKLAQWLLDGGDPPILMPGTQYVSDALTQVRGAFAKYLSELQGTIKKKMEAVIQKKDIENNLFMKQYTDVLNDFGRSRISTIKRIIQNYYEAMLSIMNRVPV